MSTSSRLTLPQRLFLRVLDAMTARAIGKPVPWMAEMVRIHGIRRGLVFASATQRANELVTGRYGIRDGQILIGLAAMWNGCVFCSRGHVWAANLYHFRERGELFALDDAEVLPMQQLPDQEALARVLGTLAAPEHARLRELIERQFHLKRGDATGESEEDRYLRVSIATWDWISECSIGTQPDQVFPPDPIARDRDLCERYLRARGRA